ncbi:uncharacterized protein [Venturia canescens]|uniref:uncharacterized protein n=1 Tax=Venturia canescens TaxID=32260 RepID=UPI001C9D3AAE|nr:uncharacterized protein LOC122414424 [Venturia canescens]
MARTKAGKKIVSALWKRSNSLGRPIGRSAKPTEKRKKKKQALDSNGDSSNSTPDTSPKSENPDTSQNAASPIVASSPSVVTVPSDRSSSSPKTLIGSAPSSSQINGTLDNNLPMTRNASVLFHSLCYSEDVLSSLPNRTWAIHCTDTPAKRIVVSAVSMHESQETGLAPYYVKQIIFDERLNFEILLVNSRIVLKDKPSCISTMDEFEDLLDYVDGLKVCGGGPSVSQYSRVNPECAYRDGMNNWRHNLCSIEISNGEVCESCNSLDEILRRYAQRTRITMKSASKRKR